MRERQKGFTLLEVILAIIVAAVTGTMVIIYMSTALARSADPLNILRQEQSAQALMEQIIADYVRNINGANYSTALATLYAQDYGPSVTKTYITFDAGGNEVQAASGVTTNNVRVTVLVHGLRVTSLFSQARTSGDDQITSY